MTELTFEAFRATRQWRADLAAACPEAEFGDLHAQGWQYLGAPVYIDEVLDTWPNEARQEGRWHLLIENNEWISDDLEALERDLHKWAIGAGYTEEDAVKAA